MRIRVHRRELTTNLDQNQRWEKTKKERKKKAEKGKKGKKRICHDKEKEEIEGQNKYLSERLL